jgi:hypothetical protein
MSNELMTLSHSATREDTRVYPVSAFTQRLVRSFMLIRWDRIMVSSSQFLHKSYKRRKTFFLFSGNKKKLMQKHTSFTQFLSCCIKAETRIVMTLLLFKRNKAESWTTATKTISALPVWILSLCWRNITIMKVLLGCANYHAGYYGGPIRIFFIGEDPRLLGNSSFCQKKLEEERYQTQSLSTWCAREAHRPLSWCRLWMLA